MQSNERTYRQLHPRVIEDRPRWTWRDRLLVGACALLGFATFALVMVLVLWAYTPCAVCGR